MTGEEFDRLFREFERSAFRLETLPRYNVGGEDEQVRRFIAGEPPPPPSLAKLGWLKTIRSAVAAGKRMHRVHLVRGALTDYLRWEFAVGYPPNAEAGEEIAILHVGEGELSELGATDFWLFDDRVAVVMEYDDVGRWLGAEATTDPDVVGECCRKRDLAVALAVPLDRYFGEAGVA